MMLVLGNPLADCYPAELHTYSLRLATWVCFLKMQKFTNQLDDMYFLGYSIRC